MTLSRARSYSSLSTLSTCAMMFWYKYVRRLKKPGVNMPMHVGDCGHAALNVLYTEKWDRKLALEAFRASWGDVKPPLEGKHAYLTRAHGESVLEAYMDDREAHPTMLEEATIFTEVSEHLLEFQWPNADGSEMLSLRGIPDLAVEFSSGGHYIVDHKWTAVWVNSWWESQFKVGHQIRLYAALMQQREGITFDGGYVNAVYMGKSPKSDWSKLASSPNKLVGPLDVDPSRLAETWKWAFALQKEEELWESLGIWPQDEKACRNYGGCDFLELCQAPPGALRESLMRTRFEERKSSE